MEPSNVELIIILIHVLRFIDVVCDIMSIIGVIIRSPHLRIGVDDLRMLAACDASSDPLMRLIGYS